MSTVLCEYCAESYTPESPEAYSREYCTFSCEMYHKVHKLKVELEAAQKELEEVKPSTSTNTESLDIPKLVEYVKFFDNGLSGNYERGKSFVARAILNYILERSNVS
ncbi:MAG: hypothetical protein GY861_12850 [bacterium]|nr:hypothetical protein [bacterium]